MGRACVMCDLQWQAAGKAVIVGRRLLAMPGKRGRMQAIQEARYPLDVRQEQRQICRYRYA